MELMVSMGMLFLLTANFVMCLLTKKKLDRIEDDVESIDWKLPDRGFHAFRHRPDRTDQDGGQS